MGKRAVIIFACLLAIVVAWLGSVPPEVGGIPAVNNFLQKKSQISCMSFHPKWLFFRIPRCRGVDVVQGREIPIEINSIGLRGRESLFVPFDNVFRILVVGDSSVFGTGDLEEFSLPRMLEDELNSRQVTGARKIEVLNGGLDGAVPIQMALLAERWIRIYKPHLVLVHFSWFQQLFYNYALSQNADWKDGRVVALRPVFYSSGLPTYLSKFTNANLFSLDLMRRATDRVDSLEGDAARMKEVMEPAVLALNQMRAASLSVGSRFVVSFSSKFRIRNTYTANSVRSGFLSNFYYRFFINGLVIADFKGESLSALTEKKIETLDLPIMELRHPEKLADGMHLGRNANRDLVSALANALHTGGYLSPRRHKSTDASH